MSDSKFGDAPLKMEGQPFWVDGLEAFKDDYERPYETTYVERCVPVALEETLHDIIDVVVRRWLIDNGHEEDKDD